MSGERTGVGRKRGRSAQDTWRSRQDMTMRQQVGLELQTEIPENLEKQRVISHTEVRVKSWGMDVVPPRQ